MNPWFYELSQKLNGLDTREALQGAIAELEDLYAALSEHDREIADRLIAELYRRLEEMD